MSLFTSLSKILPVHAYISLLIHIQTAERALHHCTQRAKIRKIRKKKHDTRAQKHLKHVSHLRSTYRSRESKETEWEVVIVEAATRCFHSLTTFPIGNEKRGVW